MEPFDELLYDKIEDYLRKQLSPEETTRFEADLAADPALQEQVNLHRLEREMRERMIRDQVRNQVREWRENQPPPQKKRPWEKWLWPLLAFVALIVAVGIWWLLSQSGQEGNRQVPVPHSPLQIPSDTTGKTVLPPEQKKEQADISPSKSKPGTPLASAERVRQERRNFLDRDLAEWDVRGKKEIQIILDQYGGLSPEDDQYEESRLKLGRAYLHTGNNVKAAEIFQYIMAKYTPGSKIFQRAQWYQALILLNEYPANQAEISTLLQQIAKPDSHPYRGDAIRLLPLLDGGF